MLVNCELAWKMNKEINSLFSYFVSFLARGTYDSRQCYVEIIVETGGGGGGGYSKTFITVPKNPNI